MGVQTLRKQNKGSACLHKCKTLKQTYQEIQAVLFDETNCAAFIECAYITAKVL